MRLGLIVILRLAQGFNGMNKYTKGFCILVWLGILVNAVFWVPALFAPQIIIKALEIDPNFSTVWLRNVGMLLLLVAIFNAGAAVAPGRYPLYSWFVVLARLIAASFFLEIWLVDGLGSSGIGVEHRTSCPPAHFA